MSVTFADLRAMLAEMPPLTWDYEASFSKTLQQLALSGYAFSAAETVLIQQLAQVQNKPWPILSHPRVALYAAAYPNGLSATQQAVAALGKGDAPLTRLCGLVDADLRVYDMAIDNAQPMDETAAAHAISYGLMAVDDKTDCLIIATLSSGVAAALAELSEALRAGDDAFAALTRYAGPDLCAMTGALLASRMARIPVLTGAACYPVLQALVSSLLPGPSVLLAPSASSWSDAAAALRQVQEIRTWLAPFSPAGALMQIAKIA